MPRPIGNRCLAGLYFHVIGWSIEERAQRAGANRGILRLKQPGNGVRPEPLPVPPHPGKQALGLALNAYKAYKGHTARDQERTGRDKVSEFLSGLSDADWERYRAGRAFLFTHLYNRLLAQRMPSEGQEKVARMKALTALRIGIPVYERDAEYKKRLGSTSEDDWGGDGW